MDFTQSPDSQNVTTTDTARGFEPQKAIGKGFCFDCDKPAQIEYDQWWFGNYEPPKTCQECSGHDVEFMGRVAKRIWDKLEE